MAKGSKLFGSTRLGISILSFLASVCIYTHRNEVSFAIVCMVNSTAISELEGSPSKSGAGSCKAPTNISIEDSGPKVEGSLLWTKAQQGTVLSSFYWGYICSQVVGGYVAEQYGSKMVVFSSVFIGSILSIISPMCANIHFWAFVAVRIAAGFVQGVFFPAAHSMWSFWSPPMERSFHAGFTTAGAQIGNTIVMPISGLLCQYGFAGGWPSVYYVFGIVGAVWCVGWLIYAANSPAEHRFISSTERDYIEGTIQETRNTKDKKKPSIPWKAIVTSRVMWGLLAGHFASNWGMFIMATCLPLFMRDVLGFDISSMGFLSAIPYMVVFVSINVATSLADFVRSSGWLSTVNVRRIAMTVALVGQSGFLMACGYVGCGHDVLAMVLLSLSIGCGGVAYAGFFVNYLDIAPAFAGTLLGVGQTISCVAGIIGPLIIGWLTPNGTPAEWMVVLWITFGVMITGCILFNIFASGEVQEWAKPRSNSDMEDEDSELAMKSMAVKITESSDTEDDPKETDKLRKH